MTNIKLLRLIAVKTFERTPTKILSNEYYIMKQIFEEHIALPSNFKISNFRFNRKKEILTFMIRLIEIKNYYKMYIKFIIDPNDNITDSYTITKTEYYKIY
jgi:hypothetical protein